MYVLTYFSCIFHCHGSFLTSVKFPIRSPRLFRHLRLMLGHKQYCWNKLGIIIISYNVDIPALMPDLPYFPYFFIVAALT